MEPSFSELLEEARVEKIKQGKWNEIYEARLRHEMKVIKEMGYVDYHLVVRDFCNAARQLGTIPKNEIPYCPDDFNEAVQWVKEKGFKTGVGVGSWKRKCQWIFSMLSFGNHKYRSC